MSTRSMYETIMDLPLFKGVGTDHVSSFLEKTKIDFVRFSSGESIVRVGEEVTTLKFLLTGKIRLDFPVRDGEVRVSSCFEGHDAIGASRLFGMHRNYDVDIYADGDVSIMEFGKDNYLSLLRSDPIYIINFANLLSLYSQRISETLRRFRRLGPERVIGEWLVLYTTQRSTQIEVIGMDSLLRSYGKEAVDQALREMEEKGLIIWEVNKIKIIDRELLIEYISDFEFKE